MSASVASLIRSRLLRALAAAAAVATLLVAGCASRPPAVQLPDLETWDVRTRVLANYDHWEFSGRIGVKTSDDGFNGKLRWMQESEAFRATVSGPLGIGTVRIEGDGRSVVLTDKDGNRTRLSDVEADLQSRYGWTIPVTSLRYWALGIPDPRTAAETEFNDDGQLLNLAQRDWTVSITRYRDGGGQLMPNRLTASNSGTRVRIVIDDWLFFD